MPDQKHVLILGGGTGGTITPNRLRRMLPHSVDITVIDRNDEHVYQPGLLFVPFGLTDAADLVRPRGRQLHDGIVCGQIIFT
jgi:sulfide:quinone oxidoreductase